MLQTLIPTPETYNFRSLQYSIGPTRVNAKNINSSLGNR